VMSSGRAVFTGSPFVAGLAVHGRVQANRVVAIAVGRDVGSSG
jgi:hypothetical protein